MKFIYKVLMAMLIIAPTVQASSGSLNTSLRSSSIINLNSKYVALATMVALGINTIYRINKSRKNNKNGGSFLSTVGNLGAGVASGITLMSYLNPISGTVGLASKAIASIDIGFGDIINREHSNRYIAALRTIASLPILIPTMSTLYRTLSK